MNDKIDAVVRFQHDLEDGWYRVDYAGKVQELNHWKDMREFIKENNLAAVWKGDIYYKPKDIEVAA